MGSMPYQVIVEFSGLCAVVQQSLEKWFVILAKSKSDPHKPLMTFDANFFRQEIPSNNQKHYSTLNFNNNAEGYFPLEQKKITFFSGDESIANEVKVDNLNLVADIGTGNPDFKNIDPGCLSSPPKNFYVDAQIELSGGSLKVQDNGLSDEKLRWYHPNNIGDVVEDYYAERFSWHFQTLNETFRIIVDNFLYSSTRDSNELFFKLKKNETLKISIGNHPPLPDSWEHSKDIYDLCEEYVDEDNRRVPVRRCVYDESCQSTSFGGPLRGTCNPSRMYINSGFKNERN